MDALYEKIAQGKDLTYAEREDLFLRSDAQELIKMMIINKVYFFRDDARIFALPHPEEVIRLMIVYGLDMSENFIKKIFDLPKAHELIQLMCYEADFYLGVDGLFSQKIVEKMFTIAHAEEVVKTYVLTGGKMSSDNEAKIFDLSNAGEIVILYLLKGNSLDEDNHNKILSLPNGAEIAALITRFGHLEDEVYHQAKEKGWI